MNEFQRICSKNNVALVSQKEIEELRCAHSKTFDIGAGRRHTRIVASQIHYIKDGKLLDIDLSPADMGDYWLIDKATYTLKLFKQKPIFHFNNAEYRLLDECEVKNHREWMGKDFKLEILITPSGISTKATVWAPKTFMWEVKNDTPEVVELGMDGDNGRPEVLRKFEDGILTEEFTGRVSKIVDKKTRRRAFVNDVKYPVVVRS